MDQIRIALVGYGSVARKDHVPVISRLGEFELAAIVEPNSCDSSLPTFKDVDELVSAMPDIDAVSVCTPPQVRFGIAECAIRRGLHVMLEKPPCRKVAEVDELIRQSTASGTALFATWYARCSAAVAPAREILHGTSVRAAHVKWHEDVREWHPGQHWLWDEGGFGAFDPGINALSLLTTLLPGRLSVVSSELSIPSNRAMPAAVRLQLATAEGIPVDVDVDMLRPRTLIWDIAFETDAGRIVLSEGGASLSRNGQILPVGPSTKYLHLYRRFGALVRETAIDVDTEPLRIVEEALAAATRRTIEPFVD